MQRKALQKSLLEGKPCRTSQYTTSSFLAATKTEIYSYCSLGYEARLSSVPLRLRKEESEQAIQSTYITVFWVRQLLSSGIISSAYILRISLYFCLFFSIGVDFKFLQEQPISPKCREIIDLEKLRLYLMRMYLESYTAVQKGRSVSARSIILYIYTDFLYFRFFWREAISAPPRTRLVALNSLNLCRMVEQPRCSCWPISFKLNWGFFPSSFWVVYSMKMRFMSASFYLVIVVLTLRLFLCFLLGAREDRLGLEMWVFQKEGGASNWTGAQGLVMGYYPSVGSVIEMIYPSRSVSLISESLAVKVECQQGCQSQYEWCRSKVEDTSSDFA